MDILHSFEKMQPTFWGRAIKPVDLTGLSDAGTSPVLISDSTFTGITNLHGPGERGLLGCSDSIQFHGEPCLETSADWAGSML